MRGMIVSRPEGMDPRASGNASSGGSGVVAQNVEATADREVFSVTRQVPAGAAFAFVEVIGHGGYTGGSGTGSANPGGGGGAGNDAILACVTGGSYTVAFSSILATGSSEVTMNGTTVSAADGVHGSGGTGGLGGAGKYPGANGANASVGNVELPGAGGGRLAQPIATSVSASPTGAGGRGTTSSRKYGGNGMAVITFFETEKQALAFANSLYDGAWAP
jgi:hypothetical protein